MQELTRSGDQINMIMLVAMKPGEIIDVNWHRLERVAAGWMVDDRFTATPRGLKELLYGTETTGGNNQRDVEGP